MMFKESETIEFKKSTAELKEAVISIVAMLNKHGHGEVYFGIDDRSGKVLGMNIGRMTIKDVTQAVVDNTEPKIYPKVEARKIEGKDCVVVEAHGINSPYFAYGRAYIRVGESEVWLPDFFSSDFKSQARKKGAKVVEVTASRRICEGASTSGVIEGWIKEQSLVLDTRKGLVLVTGCAHPRIVHIIARVKELFQKDIFMALGGFHLAGFDEKYIKEIILSFRESGIRKVGPAHCSGDEARRLFGEEYRDDFNSQVMIRRTA